MSLIDVFFGGGLKRYPSQKKPTPTPRSNDPRRQQVKPGESELFEAPSALPGSQTKPEPSARVKPPPSQFKPGDLEAAVGVEPGVTVNQAEKESQSFVARFKTVISNPKYRIADRKFFFVTISPESAAFSNDTLRVLSYLVQEIDVPTLSINDTQANIDTELGAFRTPDLNARLQTNEKYLTIKFLDTEYSFVEAFFFRWMQLVMAPMKVDREYSFTRANIYVDYYDNANENRILRYTIHGAYPTNIAPPTAVYGEGRGGITRTVQFHFNHIEVEAWYKGESIFSSTVLRDLGNGGKKDSLADILKANVDFILNQERLESDPFNIRRVPDDKYKTVFLQDAVDKGTQSEPYKSEDITLPPPTKKDSTYDPRMAFQQDAYEKVMYDMKKAYADVGKALRESMLPVPPAAPPEKSFWEKADVLNLFHSEQVPVSPFTPYPLPGEPIDLSATPPDQGFDFSADRTGGFDSFNPPETGVGSSDLGAFGPDMSKVDPGGDSVKMPDIAPPEPPPPFMSDSDLNRLEREAVYDPRSNPELFNPKAPSSVGAASVSAQERPEAPTVFLTPAQMESMRDEAQQRDAGGLVNEVFMRDMFVKAKTAVFGAGGK